MALKINMFGPFVVNHPFGTEIAFRKGFEKLGHDVRAIDPNLNRDENPDPHYDADFSLVFKDAFHWNQVIKDEIRGHKVLYQPDDQRFDHIADMMKKMRDYCDFALTFDRRGEDWTVTRHGYEDALMMAVTADNELYRHMDFIVKDIDVSFVGSLGDPVAHASRRKMIQLLQKEGLNVVYGSTNDVQQIVSIYNRSKLVVNHATDVGQSFGWGYGFQCRHFEVGFTKTCFLSNYIYDEDNQGGPRFFWRFRSEEDLIQKALFLVNESGLARTSQAELLYEELNKEHLPEHRAASIIEWVKTL